jgi:hypothetical protein
MEYVTRELQEEYGALGLTSTLTNQNVYQSGNLDTTYLKGNNFVKHCDIDISDESE